MPQCALNSYGRWGTWVNAGGLCAPAFTDRLIYGGRWRHQGGAQARSRTACWPTPGSSWPAPAWSWSPAWRSAGGLLQLSW